jgi:hypothetical protein
MTPQGPAGPRGMPGLAGPQGPVGESGAVVQDPSAEAALRALEGRTSDLESNLEDLRRTMRTNCTTQIVSDVRSPSATSLSIADSCASRSRRAGSGARDEVSFALAAGAASFRGLPTDEGHGRAIAEHDTPV